jgi:alpha-1,2-mannosyltransferase
VPAIDTQGDESCRLELERLSGRTFWFLWATIILISAAFYYEKAADHRSAFVRWRPQVLQFWSGVNIYDKMLFPNPPIMPISLYPLMVLPTVTGAMCWFAIKVAMTTAVLLMCFEIVRPTGRSSFPPMMRSLILLLALRPILGDLHHGNNNLVILFLVMSMYYAWRKGWDIGAGLLLALATSYKVTPALFFIYFAYKRSWRTLGWGLLGLGIFLIIVPSAVIGPHFNGECLGMWWHRMITPFIVRNASSAQEVNQSLLAVLMRLLTNLTLGQGRYDSHVDVNLMSLPSWMVGYLFKAVALGMVGLLAYLCRTKTTDRRDPRAELEASLCDGAASLQLSGRRVFLEPARSAQQGALGWFLGPDVLADGGCVGRLGGPLCGGAGPRNRTGLRIISVGRGRLVRDGRLEGVVAAD